MSEPESDPKMHLCGVYAFSYSGWFILKTVSLEKSHQTFAGYINFDGMGNLVGGGKGKIYNYAPPPLPAPPTPVGTSTLIDIGFHGTYDVTYTSWNTPATGKIITIDNTLGTVIEYYFVAADSFRELKFVILSTSVSKLPIIADTMRKF